MPHTIKQRQGESEIQAKARAATAHRKFGETLSPLHQAYSFVEDELRERLSCDSGFEETQVPEFVERRLSIWDRLKGGPPGLEPISDQEP